MTCDDGDYAIEVHGVLEVAVRLELHVREVGLARDGRAAGDEGVRGWHMGCLKLACREKNARACMAGRRSRLVRGRKLGSCARGRPGIGGPRI